MMSTFGVAVSSSVEALAFNYYRYGLVVLINHIWTLVALVTAAVSFWRFKLIPSLARRRLIKSSASVVLAAENELQIEAESEPAGIAPLRREVAESDRVVKGNRVYARFCYDDVIVDEEEELHEKYETQRFDVLERMRLSDLGFYDFQDFRVLDGNVVKLWDNTCRLRSKSRLTNVVRFAETASYRY